MWTGHVEPSSKQDGLSTLAQPNNPQESKEEDYIYYMHGLNAMQKGKYDIARLLFEKTIQVSSPKRKWYSSAHAKLLEINNKDK